jgi:hypothetical protein
MVERRWNNEKHVKYKERQMGSWQDGPAPERLYAKRWFNNVKINK